MGILVPLHDHGVCVYENAGMRRLSGELEQIICGVLGIERSGKRRRISIYDYCRFDVVHKLFEG
jgi:hypothetical protein